MPPGRKRKTIQEDTADTSTAGNHAAAEEAAASASASTSQSTTKEERKKRALEAKEKARAWKEKRALKKASTEKGNSSTTGTTTAATKSTTGTATTKSNNSNNAASTTSVRKGRRSSTTSKATITAVAANAKKKQEEQEKVAALVQQPKVKRARIEKENPYPEPEEEAKKDNQKTSTKSKSTATSPKRKQSPKKSATASTKTSKKSIVAPQPTVTTTPAITTAPRLPTMSQPFYTPLQEQLQQNQYQRQLEFQQQQMIAASLAAAATQQQQSSNMQNMQMNPSNMTSPMFATPYTTHPSPYALVQQQLPQPQYNQNMMTNYSGSSNQQSSSFPLQQRMQQEQYQQQLLQQQQQHLPVVQQPPLPKQQEKVNKVNAHEKKEEVVVVVSQEPTNKIEIEQEEKGAEELDDEQKDEKQLYAQPTLFHLLLSKVQTIMKYTIIAIFISFVLLYLLSFLLSSLSNNSTTTTKLLSDGNTSMVTNTANGKLIDGSSSKICFRNHGFEKEIKISANKDDDDKENDKETTQIVNVNGVANCYSFEEQNDTDYVIQECPLYGRCLDGKLVDCTNYNASSTVTDSEATTPASNNVLFIPSKSGNECILSSYALEQMMKLHSTIVDLTIDYTCHHRRSLDCKYKLVKQNNSNENDTRGSDEDSEGHVMFDVQSIISNKFHNTMDASTIHYLIHHMENGSSKLLIHKEEEGNENENEWIGLSSTYITNELPIPSYCWIQLFTFDIVYHTIKSVIRLLFWIVSTIMWKLMIQSYPLPTLIVTSIAIVISWMKRKRQNVQLVRQQVATIQNLVYDKLMIGDKEGCASLHVRDDIIHELYPVSNMKERKEFIQTVWPRVVVAVRMDNRVRKSMKSVRGKSLEWWEWVAGKNSSRMVKNSDGKSLKVE